MSLHTGKRLHGNKWEEVPFDDEVIKRVGVLAENEKQPLLDKRNMTFGWNIDTIINYDDVQDEESILAE